MRGAAMPPRTLTAGFSLKNFWYDATDLHTLLRLSAETAATVPLSHLEVYMKTDRTNRTDIQVIKFIEGTRAVAPSELQANSITRYKVTEFYREQITNSGYHDQLKYIVEPSLEEFTRPGNLDTSGERDNTIVPGFQHK
ncbi:hypothetical protein J4T87_0024205 (plasmid) [Rhizobium sp. T1473]|uniref:hypothetical protein n=2 Tax=unclassified Rhizobium TaxID=2613769 RepID=UPI001CD4AAEE|nr:hypothetical protein [Rhizobium sp. T1473]